ncbi:hypothetical protein ACE3MS_06660 [Paenibacillus dendritiformis]|uniref:hypothetical protein n=1 Tax=Paenibacillus dendritiformis TaxID=130049 RepID=UPI003653D0A0
MDGIHAGFFISRAGGSIPAWVQHFPLQREDSAEIAAQLQLFAPNPFQPCQNGGNCCASAGIPFSRSGVNKKAAELQFWPKQPDGGTSPWFRRARNVHAIATFYIFLGSIPAWVQHFPLQREDSAEIAAQLQLFAPKTSQPSQNGGNCCASAGIPLSRSGVNKKAAELQFWPQQPDSGDKPLLPPIEKCSRDCYILYFLGNDSCMGAAFSPSEGRFG